MKTMETTNWNANETMNWLRKQRAIVYDSQEGQAIYDVIKAYGFDDDIVMLTPSNLYWLCTHIMTLGIRFGMLKERARVKNAKQKNTVR